MTMSLMMRLLMGMLLVRIKIMFFNADVMKMQINMILVGDDDVLIKDLCDEYDEYDEYDDDDDDDDDDCGEHDIGG